MTCHRNFTWFSFSVFKGLVHVEVVRVKGDPFARDLTFLKQRHSVMREKTQSKQYKNWDCATKVSYVWKIISDKCWPLRINSERKLKSLAALLNVPRLIERTSWVSASSNRSNFGVRSFERNHRLCGDEVVWTEREMSCCENVCEMLLYLVETTWCQHLLFSCAVPMAETFELF